MPAAGHAIAHLRRRGLLPLASCPLDRGEDVVIALDPASGSLVLVQVSTAAPRGRPVRLDTIALTLDGAGRLARLDHREGPR